MTEPLRVISYGGGVQSTAMVVLAAQGVIDYPIALFSNVGDDSEHPATLEYVRNIAIPWAAERGVEIHELNRIKRDGTVETLFGRLTKPGSRSVGIPVRMSNGAPGNRNCTVDFKIKVVGKWLKQHGASPDNLAQVAIGISTDEIQRVNSKQTENYQNINYPLIDLLIDRSRCEQIIAEAGLPVPPKSSCFFCPYHRPQTWREMRRDEPELFQKSVELERHLNTVRDTIGKDRVWFTSYNKPLDEAISEAQTPLDLWAEQEEGPDSCDSGHCFT
jgi:PP-loop superfamily ATP-utilizing enzyme